MTDTGTQVDLRDLRSEMKREQRRLMWGRVRRNKALIGGGAVVVLLVLAAVMLPPLLKLDPLAIDAVNRLKAPGDDHLMGTDNYGRDLFARVIVGAQTSLLVGFVVAILTSVLGAAIGLIASYYRTMDHILMRICDGLMAIPAILLAIALMAALGPKVENVIIALTIVFTPYMARIVRSRAIAVKEEVFVEATKVQGAGGLRIILRHLAPNTISVLVVQATFVFADSIITEAALSFLGAGVPPPAPSWGNILYDGKAFIFNASWMTVFPSAMLIVAVVALNIFGDGLRDLVDPRGSGLTRKRRGMRLPFTGFSRKNKEGRS